MSERVQKGDYAEQAIVLDLLKRNYKVARPIGTDWPFDLILYRNDKFERIQVKWCFSDEYKIPVSARSTSYSSKIQYTDKMIDWLAAFDANCNKCYYIPSTVLGNEGRSAIYLKLKDSNGKNQHSKEMLLAKDYENI
jgi:hypothetical protein